MTPPSSAWRSPLSILLGARRNDHEATAALDYSNDYQRDWRDRDSRPHRDGGGVSQKQGLFSYYWPFAGSDAAATDAGVHHNENGDAAYERVVDELNSLSSFVSPPPAGVPPRGAFPPPLSKDTSNERGAEAEEAAEVVDETDQFREDYTAMLENQYSRDFRVAAAAPNDAIEDTDSDAAWLDQKAIAGTTFNFTNSIIGAGAMGLGGAFAASGGCVSVILLISFALLTKLSLDLVIDLSSSAHVRKRLESMNAEKRRGAAVTLDADLSMCDGRDGNDAEDGILREWAPAPRNEAAAKVEFERPYVVHEIDDSEKDDSTKQKKKATLHEPAGNEKHLEAGDGAEKKYGNGNDDGHDSKLPAPEKETVNKANDSSPLDPGEELSPLLAAEEGDSDEGAHDGLHHPLPPVTWKERSLNRYDSLSGTAPLHLQPFSPFDRPQTNTTSGDTPRPRLDTHQNHLSDSGFNAPDSCSNAPKASPLPATYEELGRAAYGSAGRLAVLLSKALYSFGCLVAYVVVVRDNLGVGLRQLPSAPSSSHHPVGNGAPPLGAGMILEWTILGIGCDEKGDSDLDADRCHRHITDEGDDDGWVHRCLNDDKFLTFLVSAVVMLPLSCPRTIEPLAKFSFVSVLSIMFLLMAVVYLYFTCTDPAGGASDAASFYENWVRIRSFSGFVESLGTFVFTFACHHTANLAYESLPIPIQNPRTWRRVSTNSIFLAAEASLAIGVFAYLTFGSQTPADILMAYPPDLRVANLARLLLCLTMLLTFPLPFLICREMIVLVMVDFHEFIYSGRLGFLRNECLSYPKLKIIRRRLWTWLFKNQTYNQREKCEGAADVGDNVTKEQEEVFVEMTNPFLTRGSGWKWSWRRFRSGLAKSAGAGEEGWWDGIDQDGGHALESLLTKEDRAHVAGKIEDVNAMVDNVGITNGGEDIPSPLINPASTSLAPNLSRINVHPSFHDEIPRPSWLLVAGDGRQLILPWHSVLTFSLWSTATFSAIMSPSLGDVLNLVGAFTGTLLAFVLPAVFSFKLNGYSHLSMTILGVGGVVGAVGTIFSFTKFVRDASL